MVFSDLNGVFFKICERVPVRPADQGLIVISDL